MVVQSINVSSGVSADTLVVIRVVARPSIMVEATPGNTDAARAIKVQTTSGKKYHIRRSWSRRACYVNSCPWNSPGCLKRSYPAKEMARQVSVMKVRSLATMTNFV